MRRPSSLGPRHGHLLAGLCTLAATVCTAQLAQADVHLAIGSRIEPLRYTSAYFPNTNAMLTPELNGNGFQSTALAPYFGVFFAQKYGVILSLDIAYAKSAGEIQAMGAPMPTVDNNSYFQFGVGLGFKTYFSQIKASKVAPYLYVDVFKYFASVSTDNMAISGEQAAAQASLRSPTGGTLAFGAEYFFSPGFSIGSEIFGLRVSGVSSEYRDMSMARHSATYTQVAFYTGITMNFRFQVQASVQNAEDKDDGDETPPASSRRRRRAPQPESDTPPPPPPTPEAVD